jgi:hypothetical protein
VEGRRPQSKVTHAHRAQRVGIAALLLWPLSYAWVPLAERSPAWVLVLVLLAEIGAVVLGVAAIWSGVQARRREGDSTAARWAIGLGGFALKLVVAGNLLGLVLLS